jgi:pyruvate/2-oxoglutarate dehydrogenase complex dihydrolipoamide dehydrogenase (E3) component/uncharacterized membrane protein YdjX (TVP38/TMEM64 family)
VNARRVLIAALVIAAIVGFFSLDLSRYFSLEFLKQQQASLDGFYRSHPWQTALLYFLIYVLVTGLSLPGAVIMTLAGGAVFGLLWGTVIISFASTIGATLAFLAARFVLREPVQRRFGKSLRAVNEGVRRDGAFYLFTLRLVPAFPFFVINLVMGLTPIRTATFYLVSQAGMLAGTIVYVNAGTQLAKIESASGILSPQLLIAFSLLGVFPWIARKALAVVKARRALAGYPRPRRFDRNLVVIGAGSAGLVAAYIAAAVKAKVTLIEKHRMGGDCLNTGCVPSKALIRSARFIADARRAEQLGFRQAQVDFDFADVMARVRRVIRRIEPHDSVERYTGLGVECIQGEARITSPWSVEVDGRTLTTRGIVVATGARPRVPAIPGIEDVGYYTSDTIWNLDHLPERMLVLGGGAIGCELAQCFARFGARVTVVQRGPGLLKGEDPEVGEALAARLRDEGVDLRLDHSPEQFRRVDGSRIMVCSHEDRTVEIPFDALLVAVGRTPNVTGFGLEELGVALSDNGTIAADAFLQTNFPNIYVCGDVAGPFQFTHTAAHQAWYATVNALFGGLKRFKADYRTIPRAVFTDPEVARVGLNETEARQREIDYEVTRFGLDELDRAIADEAAQGFVKVLTVPGRDRILGATVVGEHASEIIAELVTAMRHGIGLNKILGTIHIYPTLSEANKYAAGAWKRAHAPHRVLGWLERYHAWRRRERQRPTRV